MKLHKQFSFQSEANQIRVKQLTLVMTCHICIPIHIIPQLSKIHTYQNMQVKGFFKMISSIKNSLEHQTRDRLNQHQKHQLEF